MRSTTLFLSLLILLAGCRDLSLDAAGDQDGRASRALELAPGDRIELAIGDQAVLAGTGLTFAVVAVTEDSRCPDGATCLQAGHAGVLVRATWDHDGGTTTSQIPLRIRGLVVTPFDGNDVAVFRGFRFQLQRLLPYPSVSRATGHAAYRALIRVDGQGI